MVASIHVHTEYNSDITLSVTSDFDISSERYHKIFRYLQNTVDDINEFIKKEFNTEKESNKL